MMSARPFHRAHERLIRITLEKTDLLVIFLLKPYTDDIISYELKLKTLQYFVDNYLPRNKVVIVPFENTYIFAGPNNAVLDSICAYNLGCDKLVLGQNHSGIGMYYDKNEMKTINLTETKNCYKTIVKTIPNSKAYLYFFKDGGVQFDILNLVSKKEFETNDFIYYKVLKHYKDKVLVQIGSHFSEEFIGILHQSINYIKNLNKSNH